MSRHVLQIAREEHKFSAAHMTVFPDGSKERLHGHNFQLLLRMEVRSIEAEDLCDFGIVKRALRELCAELNERTLVAAHNPHLRAVQEEDRVRLLHPSGDYLLPRADVVLLPLTNISTEQLARWAHGEIARRLRGRLPDVVEGLEIGVLESPGQGAYYAAPL